MLFWFGCGFASLLFIVMLCVISGEKWKPETVGHLFIIIAAILLGPLSLFLAVLFTVMDVVERIDWDNIMNKPLPSIKITLADEKEDKNG